MSDKIRFAVIGYGHIGKRHAEMIYRNSEASLSAIVDNNPEHPNFNQKYQVPQFHSLEEFLSQSRYTEVVSIATPNGLHATQAMLALEAGKHVVIEKPIALRIEETLALVKRSEEVDRKIFTVMQNRYSPPSIWIKGIVQSGVLGKIYMVQVNCFWNRDEQYYTEGSWRGTFNLDGGTLYTQYSHFVDMLYWIFGDIKNINATFADFNHQLLTEFEDSGFVNFEFLNGGLGCFNYSTAVWNQNFESSMTVIAEKGSIKIGGQYMDRVEYCNIKDYRFNGLEPTNEGNDYGHYKGSAQNHHFVIANIIDVLKGRAEIHHTAEEAFHVIDIINRIYAQRDKAFFKTSNLDSPTKK